MAEHEEASDGVVGMKAHQMLFRVSMFSFVLSILAVTTIMLWAYFLIIGIVGSVVSMYYKIREGDE